MRTTERSTAFRRDFKRAKANPRNRDFETLLKEVIAALARDVVLPARLMDHPLSGPWIGYRDCHVKPDLVLVYRKSGADLLELVRLGTHSELFGN